MKMLLRPEFRTGYFDDPALYIRELNTKQALLVDCGDLSRYATRQLLRVSHIFLSHCHIDHFFGFDHFLRVHVGSEKTVTIMGPPQTSERVAGKLQGYTWNLISDQKLQFVVIDLEAHNKQKRTTRFHARERFKPGRQTIESWNPEDPILDVGTYAVKTATLDHRTPSMAYSIEEKVTVGVNSARLKEMKLSTGPWLNDLKTRYLAGDHDRYLRADSADGTVRKFKVSEAAAELLVPRQRHKIAYATDGAASLKNHEALAKLIECADVFYSETCFLEADRAAADETKHFTAEFVAKLAASSGVKRLVPFHFSKRYLEEPDLILREIAKYYVGTMVPGAAEEPAHDESRVTRPF